MSKKSRTKSNSKNQLPMQMTNQFQMPMNNQPANINQPTNINQMPNQLPLAMPNVKSISKSLNKNKNSQHYHEGICCEVTFCGLNKWYKEEFEKIGWMILANSKGMKDKVNLYKTSLNNLKEALEHKLTHTSDPDKIQDIHIMLYNVNILIDHAKKDFN